MPKSITFGTGSPSCSVTRMFDGFRSRWMMPFWWACCTAWQTCTNSSQPLARRAGRVLVAVLGDRARPRPAPSRSTAGRRRSRRRRAPWRCSGGPSAPAPAARPRTGRRPALRVHAGLMTLSATVGGPARLLGHADDAHAALAEQLAAAGSDRNSRPADQGPNFPRMTQARRGIVDSEDVVLVEERGDLSRQHGIRRSKRRQPRRALVGRKIQCLVQIRACRVPTLAAEHGHQFLNRQAPHGTRQSVLEIGSPARPPGTFTPLRTATDLAVSSSLSVFRSS